MRTLVVAGFLAVVLIASCKKDQDAEPLPPAPNYTPLSVGSYWIYENYSISPDGNETSTNRIDSVVVTHDTLINGKTYAVIEGNGFIVPTPWRVLGVFRDSSDCMVDQFGGVHFSSENFTDTLGWRTEIMPSGDTLFTAYWMMYKEPLPVTVPAGSFSALSYRATIYTFSPGSSLPNPRYQGDTYAAGVGKILESAVFIGGGGRLERRLLRYHIAP